MTQERIGVVCALRSEARHFGGILLKDLGIESLAGGALLVATGIGWQAAAAGADRLAAAGAGALVSWGMAGGLDPELPAGQIFLPSEIVGPDGTLFTTNIPWRESLGATLRELSPLGSGRLVTVNAPVGTVEAKALLFKRSGARAVDMESAAIAQVARSRSLPLLAIRVIVDRASEALPDAIVAASAPGKEISSLRLLGHLVSSPTEYPRVLRLIGSYLRANRSLAKVVASGALPPRKLASSASNSYSRGVS